MTQSILAERRPAASPSRRHRRSSPTKLPPAIIVGGDANALSIARSLGRRGVKVYALGGGNEHVRHSRYAQWIPLRADGSFTESCTDFLLGPQAEPLHGAVLLAASDPALEILAYNREELERRYLLDESNPQAQLCMLNKLSTYEIAVAAGVATPRFWLAASRERLEELRPSLVFPLIVKPHLSHLFESRYGRKFFVANSFDELIEAHSVVCDTQIEVMLVELIPGLDDQLCSYYTYLDERGEPLFDFTKRIIRRNPPGMGGACYHVTDWVPEVREPSLRLFRQAGLRGLANVEFKRDCRDGQLKLIECNARFTAPNCLIERAGFDLARFVYNRVVGLPQTRLTEFRRGLRLWFPIEDFKAFRTLRREGRITLGGWLASLCHRQTLPFFRFSDPLPTVADQFRRVKRKLWPW
jgi:D-aspartate ligase